MLEFNDLKQLIVLIALVFFAGAILISELFFGYRASDSMVAILNIIIGALVGVLSSKALELFNKKGFE